MTSTATGTPSRIALTLPAARIGIGGVLLGSVIIGLLHVIGPGAAISPIRRTISEYMLTSAAWAFDLGVLCIAAGSIAVLAAVAGSGRTAGPGAAASTAGLIFGALWVVGLVTLVAFPKADWALGPSVSGQVHRAASLVAFVALPLAVLVLARPGAARGRLGGTGARWATALAVTGLAWFLPIIVAIVTGANGGRWWTAVPLGLVERGMAVTEIAALVALGAWAIRRMPSSPAAVTGIALTSEPAVTDVVVTTPAQLDAALGRAPAADPAAP